MFLNKLFGPQIVFGSSGGSRSSSKRRSSKQTTKRTSGGGKGSSGSGRNLPASSKRNTANPVGPPKNKSANAPTTVREDVPIINPNKSAPPAPSGSSSPVNAPETIDSVESSGGGGGGRDGGGTAKRRASETNENNLTIKRASEGAGRYKRRRTSGPMAIRRS